jgi:hypothetical protein
MTYIWFSHFVHGIHAITIHYVFLATIECVGFASGQVTASGYPAIPSPGGHTLTVNHHYQHIMLIWVIMT